MAITSTQHNIFQNSYFFNKATSTIEIPFSAVNFSEKLLFWKQKISIMQQLLFMWVALSKRLIFQTSYFFATYLYRGTYLLLHFLHFTGTFSCLLQSGALLRISCLYLFFLKSDRYYPFFTQYSLFEKFCIKIDFSGQHEQKQPENVKNFRFQNIFKNINFRTELVKKTNDLWLALHLEFIVLKNSIYISLKWKKRL